MGQLIRMFLVDDTADGIKTLELSNKTIFCTLFPRPMFEKFKKREEFSRPGVYILVGVDQDVISNKIYIGEGDPVGDRLASHYGKKDFWTDAIVFTSKDDYLTKTQIQYIESKLIKKAFECKQANMDNNNIPQLPNISEVDEAEVNAFLNSLLLLISALGYNLFTPIAKKEEPKAMDVSNNDESPLFEFVIKKRPNIHGLMKIKNGRYVLLAGSKLELKDSDCASQYVKSNRKKIIEAGLVEQTSENFVLKEDVEFKSSSGAGSTVYGINTNGLTSWKYNGKTLAEYEENE